MNVHHDAAYFGSLFSDYLTQNPRKYGLFFFQLHVVLANGGKMNKYGKGRFGSAVDT